MTASLPFAAALGEMTGHLPPALREQVIHPAGARHYRGTMSRVWYAPGWRGALVRPFCWLGRRASAVFSSPGTRVPFELDTVVHADSEAATAMTWVRTFHFAAGSQVFRGVITHDPRRGVLIDRVGRAGRIEVELTPTVDVGTGVLSLRSGRQWLHVARLRLRLPRWLVGSAEIREWQGTDGTLYLTLSVRHPLLGEIYGYEGTIDPRHTDPNP